MQTDIPTLFVEINDLNYIFKTFKNGNLIINARSETVNKKKEKY